MPYAIPDLPPPAVAESAAILKATIAASRALADLRGEAKTLPNPGILIDTLALQEAQASSEIENYVTTQDEVFRVGAQPSSIFTGPQKEVARYRDALRAGFEMLEERGSITNNVLIAMFRLLKSSDGGFRTTPGTRLRNDVTGEVVYTPPQHPDEIRRHMSALERYINTPAPDGLDPLVRMAVIHHQFESIHPFSDGNGRIGRILNVLYLTHEGLLDAPILYLSRYINATKVDYYRLLQSVRDDGAWEPWIAYVLSGIGATATETLGLVKQIRGQMTDMKRRLRDDFPAMYSQELLNNLFRHPYTRIEYLMSEAGVSRPTASKYLNVLAAADVLGRTRSGRNVYYVNRPLVAAFLAVHRERGAA